MFIDVKIFRSDKKMIKLVEQIIIGSVIVLILGATEMRKLVNWLNQFRLLRYDKKFLLLNYHRFVP